MSVKSNTTVYFFDTDYDCTTGDNFGENFLRPYYLADYSKVLSLVFSFMVLSRALQKWREWKFWVVISTLIAIQSASSLIFSSSFVCTDGVLFSNSTVTYNDDSTYIYYKYLGDKPYYLMGKKVWDYLYISFYFLASATQSVVDLLWIYVYTDAVYEKQNEAN